MKLELKHLANYLPYTLKCEIENGWIERVVGLSENSIDTSVGNNWDYSIKPLLLPLSALTEQLSDGSVPIVELAKIAFPKSKTIKLDINEGMAIIDTAENYSFQYKNNSFECVYLRYSPKVQICYVPNQLQLFEYLFANHFDVYGLINAGLAIDKRTVK